VVRALQWGSSNHPGAPIAHDRVENVVAAVAFGAAFFCLAGCANVLWRKHYSKSLDVQGGAAQDAGLDLARMSRIVGVDEVRHVQGSGGRAAASRSSAR
jgi:hypothetical protein